MADPITQAVQEVQQVASGDNMWWHLALSYLIGGAVSAIWTWREGRVKPRINEIVSTALSSGAISACIVAYLMGRGITLPMIICISILTGFSGEMVIRILIRGFVVVVKRVIGDLGDPPDKKDHP